MTWVIDLVGVWGAIQEDDDVKYTHFVEDHNHNIFILYIQIIKLQFTIFLEWVLVGIFIQQVVCNCNKSFHENKI